MVKLTEGLVLARARASDLENVKKLNCWGSDLTDISILRKMPNVQVVSLSVNKIETLADFTSCHNLEELYIRKNNIQDLAEICYLTRLPKLRILWLSDNPCATADKYRMTVLKTLPNLQKLDNVMVEEGEVNEAIEQGTDLTMADTTHTDLLEKGAHESSERTGEQKEKEEKKEENSEERHETTETGEENDKKNPVTLSLEETNRIREQLGLKPLEPAKITTPKPRLNVPGKNKNQNILQAALLLVKELDAQSLEILQENIRQRLEDL